jgi:hypothetical protein
MDPLQPPDDRDADNPYAPPRSAFVPQALPDLAAGAPFTVHDVFTWSWAIFKEKTGLCLSIYWGAVAMNFAIAFGLGQLLEAVVASVRDPTLFALANILVHFAAYVVGFWLTIGQNRAYLKIARNQPVRFDEIFQGARFVLTTILATILFVAVLAVPIFGAALVITFGLVAMENHIIAGVAFFLVVSSLVGLLVVYATARLAMHYYLIIDRDAGVIDSLMGSWTLCRNEVGTITLVFFVQLALFIAGLLACGLGLILTLPLMSLLMTVTYLAVTGTRSSHPTEAEFILEDNIWNK